MTQEDKELLLKDLCARLPYGVKCKDQYGDYININIYNAHIEHLVDQIVSGVVQMVLRPISSMTEEELHEYNMHLLGITTGADAANFMIWIYQHHLDILHLIEKGLALEASKNMYNIKEK